MKSFLLSIFITFSAILGVTKVIPGGENIGVEIKPKGVVVVGGYEVNSEYQSYNPIKDSDIQKGDLIYKVNGQNIEDIKSLLSVIKKYTNDKTVNLSILRNNKEIEREMTLVKTSNANTIKTGLLVKERMLGVGTMSFYDPETKIYGALGHKLIDNDFSTITDINSGTIFDSKVIGINKSSIGNVGELLSSINEDDVLGNVYSNTEYGIYGYYNQCPDKEALEVASHDQIKIGKAYIYTTLEKDNVEKFEIQITSLQKQTKISTKGITFKITDKRLIEKTGGIVQGMSGSPIIQQNKIIGAVTHVLVDNVKKGYGIYMDFMVEMAKKG